MDPWKDRSSGMRCSSCVFFVKKNPEGEKLSDSKITADPRGYLGRCRRNAPTMKGFPIVFEADWCGDHRLDENKI